MKFLVDVPFISPLRVTHVAIPGNGVNRADPALPGVLAWRQAGHATLGPESPSDSAQAGTCVKRRGKRFTADFRIQSSASARPCHGHPHAAKRHRARTAKPLKLTTHTDCRFR